MTKTNATRRESHYAADVHEVKPTTTHTNLAIAAFRRANDRQVDSHSDVDQAWIRGWIVGFRKSRKAAR